MDIVYPYKLSGTGEELRYSLRSLKNLPHDEVWIVGDKPPWVQNVNYIRVPQNGPSKWANSRKNILTACEHPDISDDFILFNDDFFVMEEIQYVPTLHRGLITEVVDNFKRRNVNSKYVAGLVETAEMLRWAGVPDPMYAYNLHIPMVINKAKMLECFDYLKALSLPHVPYCFHLRSYYGNFWQIGGTQAKDVKIRNNRSPVPPGPFLSTNNSSFRTNRVFQDRLTKKLNKRSIYERG